MCHGRDICRVIETRPNSTSASRVAWMFMRFDYEVWMANLKLPWFFWYNTIQYNTIQYNTIQYNTIQYNTIQYNTTRMYVYTGRESLSIIKIRLTGVPVVKWVSSDKESKRNSVPVVKWVSSDKESKRNIMLLLTELGVHTRKYLFWHSRRMDRTQWGPCALNVRTNITRMDRSLG